MPQNSIDRDKIKTLLKYWIDHNLEHGNEYAGWLKRLKDEGYNDITETLGAVVDLTRNIQDRLLNALKIIDKSVLHKGGGLHKHEAEENADHHHHEHVTLHVIGEIHTPYVDRLPEYPSEDDGEFYCEIYQNFTALLNQLLSLDKIFMVYRIKELTSHGDSPARLNEGASGNHDLDSFPVNDLDASIVKIKDIDGNRITITPVSVLDGTKVIFIKKL